VHLGERECAALPAMSRTSRVLLALLACSLAAPVVALAQIYVRRDASGTIVLSDRPLGEGAVTYLVPGSSARTTKPVDVPEEAGLTQLIGHHARRHNVREDLVRAVIAVESGFNPRALSPKGAMGLMQLIPETARLYDVNRPYDPAQNIRGGVAYLRDLLDRYQGNEELALAAYNAGPGAVDRHGLQVPPYRETRDYVKRIRGRTELKARRGGLIVYRVIDVVDGREVPRYTNVRPAGGVEYEVVRKPK
jgi:soluble lytic murein transglycosylase-like protein